MSKHIRDRYDEIEALKKDLMKFLSAHDSKSLEVIDKLKKIGIEQNDYQLIGYVYYRYAYYHYFIDQDIKKFRHYLQLAIKYLLRSDDKEYLGGAYNLVAYDAQDQGCYDVAYAYFMIAIQTSEQAKGIALPGLLEANAGRLLVELGDYKKGLKQLQSAIRRIRKFTDMHVYNYNMILTFTDISLAAFLLNDIKVINDSLEHINDHYQQSTKEEIELSKTYYLLTNLYYSLLIKDDKKIKKYLDELLKHWKEMHVGEIVGLIFEIESLCTYMLENNYLTEASNLLNVTHQLSEDENFSVALKQITLEVSYYEKLNDLENLKTSLYLQNQIKNRLNSEAVETRRYAMEFSDMIEIITKEREKTNEENILLQAQANTDMLTGLPNRNAMNTYLVERFDEAERDQTLFGIGIIDVDEFKKYNDLYGHQVGDKCLRQIGNVLLTYNSSPNVFCIRYGGDEFVVGYFGLSDEEIKKISTDMANMVSEETSNQNVKVQISQGIHNEIPDGKKRIWDYLSIADQELYRIKKKK